jgi:hypothetical protein
MDPVSIVLPGAQALVTQILTDGWTQARGWLAKRLTRADGPALAELESRLDVANAEATSLPAAEDGVPSADVRRMVLEAYWAGYLAALAGERLEFAAALTELAENRKAGPAGMTTNSVTGTVTGNVIQAGRVEGGVHFG